MVFVQLFVAKIYVTLLLQRLRNHISEGNKGIQPEHKLEAMEKLASLDITTLYRTNT
jgi:hypothetical protein